MDCTHCVLQSLLRKTTPTRSSPQVSSSSDKDIIRPKRCCTSLRNTVVRLYLTRHTWREPTGTVRHQVLASLHYIHHHLDSVQLALSEKHLISHSAHDLPPALSAFSGLGSTPCNLYRIISFDKLHVVDLGIMRQFCDLTNTILQRISTTPLTKLMSTSNDRFLALHLSARLSSYRPLHNNQQESQAGISGVTRCLSCGYV